MTNHHQEAKANLWGSLAAQLEMQCGDVLSFDDRNNNNNNNLGGEEEEELLPICRRNSHTNNNGGGSRGVAVAPSSSSSSTQVNSNRNHQGAVAAAAPIAVPVTSADNSNSNNTTTVEALSKNSLKNDQLFQQQQQSSSSSPQLLLQHSPFSNNNLPPPSQPQQPQPTNNTNDIDDNATLLLQLPASHSSSSTITTQQKSSILKHWIITKKIDRQIQEATTLTTTTNNNNAPNNNNNNNEGGNNPIMIEGMEKFQKEHIVKCVKVAYLIVDKLERVEEELLNNTTTNTTRGDDGATTNNNTTTTTTTNNNCGQTSSSSFIPTASDITQDGITIIENQVTGEVMAVEFHKCHNSSSNNTNTTAFDCDGSQGGEDDDDDDDASTTNGGTNPSNNKLTCTTTTTPNNNNNNNSSSSSSSNTNGKLGSMLGALGNLFYVLFTEGESVPIVDDDDVVDEYNTPVSTKKKTTTAATSSSSSSLPTRKKQKVHNNSSTTTKNNNNTTTTTTNGHKHDKDSKTNKIHREEDAIMDILLNFAMPGDSSDREDDYIIESMRKCSSSNLPLHLCRFVSDLLYSSRVLEKEEEDDHHHHHDDGEGDSGGSGSSYPHHHHHHHEDSIFTSIADVLSDLKQMIDFPDAFLYGTVNSRWEIVFGSNHVFGREKEMDLLMSAVRRIESCNNNNDEESMSKHQKNQQQRTKEVVIISGRAGTGKSLLVQDIRKPLQGRGWIFLRCKFEKKVDPDPLSVIALGFDEFFASCTLLCSNDVSAVKDAPGAQHCCSNGCCSRNICLTLEGLMGWIGLTTLSQLMPSLRRVLNDVYPNRKLDAEEVLDTNNVQRPKHEHLFVTLLDALSQLRPVLFFTDDLQFAGDASLALLKDLVNRVGSTGGGTRSSNLLFVVAHRTVDTAENEPLLLKMLTQFEAIDFVNTTPIALRGFELESLNVMVSEALCLPRRKTRSLAEVVHQKTLGIPLFVVEFLDALLTEKLLIHNSANGWGWDVDSIDLKKISSGVAALLACKLEQLPSEVLSAVKLLSVLGSHIDRDVLEVVKTHDGSDGSTLIPSLYTAQREGLLDIAGPTFTFMHETIKQAAFNLIAVPDRIPVMLRIVACLLPHCKQDKEADAYLFTTVDIINIIGSHAVSKNLGQSQVFAQLNLNAGKKATNFRAALDYFEAGISFLQGDYWNDQYELALSLHESAAAANYSGGRHDQVAIQTNKIFSMARSFEDKFKSYCLYINVLAIGNTEKAKEQIYYLLKSLGEVINPNTVDAPMAMVDFSSLKQMLSGARKDVLLQLPPMTDRNKRMAMKLMAMLVLYYNQQMTHLSGYFACKMIRMSIQHGHCEDTVFALSVFACSTMNFLGDMQEASSLAKSALSMLRLYNSEELISRVYSRIYGAVLCFTQPMSRALPPLLKACRIAFGSGTSEQSIFNTTIYVLRSLQSGKKIPLLLDEVKAFALKHNELNHMGILQLFLAPIYKSLSNLSGITFDPSTILPQLATAPSYDVVQTAIAKNELVFVRAAVVIGFAESLFLRDFAKAYTTMTLYPNFFTVLDNLQQLKITEFEFTFIAGMLSLHWARETREVHWMQRGMNAVAAYEDWAKISPWDCNHRYHMLKAELHHTQGDTNGAIESFDAAIANTKKHNNSSHEALACEFAAHFYDSIGNNAKTKEMIQQSHDAYVRWGAAKKALALIKLLQQVPSAVPSAIAPGPGMSFL